MQDIIINLLKQDNYTEAYDAFVMYGKVYISDEFIEEYKDILYNYGPKVSVICMNCEDEVVDNFIKNRIIAIMKLSGQLKKIVIKILLII